MPSRKRIFEEPDLDEDLFEVGDDEDVEITSDEEDEEDEEGFAPSEDEEVPFALDQLQTFVSNLDVTAKKRKAPGDTDGGAFESRERRTRKRRLLQEKTEAGEENEFHVRSSDAKLNLDDLLAPLASQSSTLQSLKKSTKVLAPSGSSKLKTLSAPLPQRAQERLDREVAYEQTKEEVDKWSDTMKRIREAEHLSFPLQAQPSEKVSNFELSAKFKPTTDLERSVDNLLKASKLREEDIRETEETMLKMNKLSVEEIAQRRDELRQMRELAFRAEIKARRVKKIKSKTYRRLKRKEKERLGELNDVKGPDQSDQERSEDEVIEDSDVESVGRMDGTVVNGEEGATKIPDQSPPSPSVDQVRSPMPAISTQDVNPWLVRTEHLTGKVAKTKNAVVVSKDSKSLDKAKHRLDKQVSKTRDGRAKALDEAAVQISLNNVLRLPTSATSRNDKDDSGEETEIEAQENSLLTGKGKGNADRLAFQQRDLVALAFAGDNVVLSFEEAKRREIAADAPREVDTTLPGWGSWGGAGVRKAPPKQKRIKVIPGIDPTTRADHGNKNIIISEKKDKKVAKYLVKDLPYPYTSKAQFERTMGFPLGSEWNTRVGFQRGTLPRVVKKPGVIIEPLKKLS